MDGPETEEAKQSKREAEEKAKCGEEEEQGTGEVSCVPTFMQHAA